MSAEPRKLTRSAGLSDAAAALRPMLNRRQFCGQAVAMGATSVALLNTAGVRGEGRQISEPTACRIASEPVLTSRKFKALGTEVSIDVFHADGPQAEQAIAAAVEQLRLIERLMSLYEPASQLCRLNHDGKLKDPHPYLVDVLRRSCAMSQASGGAFDVTVQPLWEVYAAARKVSQLPDAAAVDAALANVDWRRIDILPGEIRLQGRGTRITLNAVAQGFAADRAADVLRRHGIQHALINTGEIVAIGGKSREQLWTVGIQHPRHTDAYAAVVQLADRGLATSGDYATPLSDDLREHHIFDPRIGHSPATFASVSVVAPTACDADLLATTVFVLGAESGLTLLRSKAGCEALLIFKDGRTLKTDQFPTDDS